MFKELSRTYCEATNTVTLTIYDSCFTYYMTDPCNCCNLNCPQTLSHLIRVYEKKSLNISKNLASYLMWLAQLGWHTYDELKNQGDTTEARYPRLRFYKKYYSNILQYLNNTIITSTMSKSKVPTYRSNGWSI